MYGSAKQLTARREAGSGKLKSCGSRIHPMAMRSWLARPDTSLTGANPPLRGHEMPIDNNEQRRPRQPLKAYLNEKFLLGAGARSLRILSEYLEPRSRFDRYRVDDTIVFMGSARIVSREQAERELRAAESGRGDLGKARVASRCQATTSPHGSWRSGLPSGRSSSTRTSVVSCLHRGRTRDHGGREPRRLRGAGPERGAVHIASHGGDRQQVRHKGPVVQLPLLLHAQILVRLPGEGRHRLPRRIRDPGRAF